MHFHPQVASMGLWCKDPICFLFVRLPLSVQHGHKASTALIIHL